MNLGIYGFHASLDGKIDLFEIDLFNEDLRKPRKSRVIVSLSQYFYRSPNKIPFEERLEIIESLLEDKVHLFGFSIKLTPKFFETQKLETQVLPLKRALQKKYKRPVYLDLPQFLPSRLNEKSKISLNASLDPMWEKPAKAKYWKVHGWHDTRWVRRYSQSDLTRLGKAYIKIKPEVLIFAHSLRVGQVLNFKKNISN